MKENMPYHRTWEKYPYDEKRLSVRLLRYWHETRGTRTMPVENDIDPEVLGEDWDYCFLLQARDIANVKDYNFTYLGSKILKAYFDKGVDEHNQFMIGPNAYRLSKRFQLVIDNKQPVLNEGKFESMNGRTILFRQVLLPLGEPDKPVDAIFGGMNYKFADEN